MATYQIQAPNGKTYRIQGPAGATDEQVRAQVLKQYPDASGKTKSAPRPAYSAQDLITNKMTAGLSDKAVPAATALIGMLSGKPFRDTYAQEQAARDVDREAYQKANQVTDWLTAPTNLMVGGVKNMLASAPNTLRNLSAMGAFGGLLSGLGNGRGSGQSQNAMLSSAVGAVAAPVVGKAAEKIVPPVLRKAAQIASGTPTKSPPTQTGKAILNALANQGMSPRQAGAAIQEAQKRGVPVALMDLGDETRGIASSLARKPGPNRTIMRDAVISRQEAQTERVQDALARDLGATTNPRLQSEGLIDRAKAAASPLYEAAYARPGASAAYPQIEGLLRRPSMRGALGRASRIAAEEGRDPMSLGFDLDGEGNTTLTKVPSWQTLDYVKRGLDDIIESYRDKVTGRLNLDTEGRAINNTLRDFLGTVDRVNPEYAAARAAYAGPASESTALQKGVKAISKNADDIFAETRDLNPSQLEQYRLGFRSALSEMLEGRVDGADKVRALVGTPKKRRALEYLFGGQEGLDRLMQTLADEASTSATYARVNTGSPTAANLADDAAVEGLGGIAANAGKRVLSGQGIIPNAMATFSDLARYGVGKKADRLRSELAVGLSETDPAVFAAMLRDASRNAARQRSGSAIRRSSANVAARAAGVASGKGVNALAPGGGR